MNKTLDFLSSEFIKSIDDGKTHINVYSRGRTELGRLLSNFAHTPIIINNEISHETFQSVESWWYWKKMVNMDEEPNIELLNRMKREVGVNAKKLFREHFKTDTSEFNPTEEELKDIYWTKLCQYPYIMDMLKENTLPLAHYYVMNDFKVHTDTEWTAFIWCEIYNELKK